MPRKPLPYIKVVVSRGRTYEYFDTGKSVDGKRVYNRLPHRSDKSWGQVYAGMVAGRTARANMAKVPTIKDVIVAYQKTKKFTDRAESTQSTYLVYLRMVEKAFGMAEVDAIERRDVQALLDTMLDRPGASNMTLLVLRNLFALARNRDWVKFDPTNAITMAENSEAEHEPWPEPLLEAALQDPDVGLPVALLYYSAQRIGDVCRMRWDDIRDGYLYVRQQKTRKELDIMLHRNLAALLVAAPRTGLTILHDSEGRPLQPRALRSTLQAYARKQGEKIVPHGLRKNAVIALLEAGCTIVEAGAISGQSLKLVEHYAKRRNMRRIGTAAVLKWQGTEEGHGKHGKQA